MPRGGEVSPILVSPSHWLAITFSSNKKGSAQVIFIHSSFRTGSTYLWSCFRKYPRAVAYYEIFHEILSTINKFGLLSIGPETWRSGHPPGAPYFLEFLPLIRYEGGVEGFDPGMSYRRFIPADGCGGGISATEAAYLGRLISHAEARGKIPVLTATRSLGRLRALKAALPGLHLLLYRNLFQQWCSITDQAFRGNPYFIHRISDIVRLSCHNSMINDLQQIFPIENLSVRDSNTFYTFIFLHLHLYVQTAGACDFIVDLNRLAIDSTHRDEVEKLIADQDIVVDLSGIKNSITYSLCRLGSAADVRERLKVMGDIVIDRAPDVAGRHFGVKVLSELLEEFDNHEFHTGVLRSRLFGPEGLFTERDAALGERDAMRLERDIAGAERDGLRAERDAALGERDAMRLERDIAGAERDGLRAERDAALGERDAMRLERDIAGAERDGLRAERDAALGEHDAMRLERDIAGAERDGLRAERDAALGERDAMRLERDIAGAERDGLRAERDAALGERDAMRLERDIAGAERDGLRAERDAALGERDAMRLERDIAGAERDGLRAERDAALGERDAMRLERDIAGAERDGLRAERDAIESNKLRSQGGRSKS